MQRLTLTAAVIVCTLFMLNACSADSSSSSIATPQPPYTPGVFADSSNYQAYCAAPRSGVDINGNAYTDRQGSVLHENLWLRSWTHETYLWYDEVNYQDPHNFSKPQDYFDTLKVDDLTDSGKNRDSYHFYQNTEERDTLRISGKELGYGAEFGIIRGSPPREVRVRYVIPHSPAAQAGLKRGDRIISIDNVDVLYGSDVDTLNAGTFPDQENKITHFIFEDIDTGQYKSMQLTAIEVDVQTVQTLVIDTSTSSTPSAYLHFTSFSLNKAEKELYDAFSQMQAANVQELLLDLRYNSGGYVSIAAQLAYMIAGPSHAGKVFDNLYGNVKQGLLYSSKFLNQSQGFASDLAIGTSLPSLNLTRVFILSSRRTCSASEAVINGLRGVGIDVILIGDTTCGKPYGFYSTDNCGTTYSTVQFEGKNALGQGGYIDGFYPSNKPSAYGVAIPGCYVLDDFSQPLGDPREALVAAAKHYSNTGSCPSVANTLETQTFRSVNATSDVSENLWTLELRQRFWQKHNLLVRQSLINR